MLRGLKSHPLVSFFLLTYAISWLTLGLVALASHKLLPFSIPSVLTPLLLLVGSCGPLLAALLLVATITGKDDRRVFFRKWLTWRVGFQWYLVVLFEPALVTLLVLAVTSLLGGPSFNFAHPPIAQQSPFPFPLPSSISPWLLIGPLFLLGGLLGGPLGEEPGWRGYALAKLQNRYSALGASLLLGILWAVWHLPFFFLLGTTESTTPFLFFALGMMANSILITWVYNHTRGSVLLAFLFHTALNTTELYLPLSLSGNWQGTAAQCLVALIVVIVAGPARLSRKQTVNYT